MGDDFHWDFDRAYDRDTAREPGYARPPRRGDRPQLNPRGTVRSYFERELYLERTYDTLEERRGDK